MKFRMSNKYSTFFGKVGYIFCIILFISYIVCVILLNAGVTANIMLFLIIGFFIGKILEENAKMLKQLIITKEYIDVKSWKESIRYNIKDIKIFFKKYAFERKHTAGGGGYYSTSILLLIVGNDGEILSRVFLYDINKIEDIKNCFNAYGVKWESTVNID